MRSGLSECRLGCGEDPGEVEGNSGGTNDSRLAVLNRRVNVSVNRAAGPSESED